MRFYTKEKVLALLRLVDRPLSIQEMVTVIRPDDRIKGIDNIQAAIRDLSIQGKIKQGPDRFCKPGFWCKTWTLAEVKE